nr:MAG TPA: hypothetical protein [Caudoviricetes sp.]
MCRAKVVFPAKGTPRPQSGRAAGGRAENAHQQDNYAEGE